MKEELDSLVGQMIAKGIQYEDARREFERRFVAHALERSGGSLSGAATILGLHRNTLARKVAEYRLTRAVRR